MPTGYTTDLYEGDQSFEDFVLRCARGMGALILMRDEPLDAPIPDEFTPDTSYHDDRLAEAQVQLREALAWDDDEAMEKAKEDFDAQLDEWSKAAFRRRELKHRYEQMLAQVKTWQVPSSLDSFKTFMVDQLEESIRFDCGDWPTPTHESPKSYRAKVIDRAKSDIAYHSEQIANTEVRTAERNAWLSDLRSALEKSS